jgi:hypothetical protein
MGTRIQRFTIGVWSAVPQTQCFSTNRLTGTVPNKGTIRSPALGNVRRNGACSNQILTFACALLRRNFYMHAWYTRCPSILRGGPCNSHSLSAEPSYDVNPPQGNNACGGSAGGEFETLTFSSHQSGDHCWGSIQWGAIDSQSQCHLSQGHVSYNSGGKERIFAFFKEKEDFVWV